MQEFVLTKKRKEELEKELDYLVTVRRAEISQAIKEARSFGDLSENAEYTEARNEQSRVEGQIQELEYTLRMATVVDDDEITLDHVGIGTKVRILDMDFEEENTFTLVGAMETDVAHNVISNESPVGSALIGHSVGDVVDVTTPTGAIIKFKILEISKAS
ncbi:MAG: transcription elongation factor GreA [Clostridia bacterium]|nr:transcription elongation factor GreA [Clostridia bacterium]